MPTVMLARDYVDRAQLRLRAIEVLVEGAGWTDVVGECQEAVELALKGLLREFGVEVPSVHDVAPTLLAERDRLPTALSAHVDDLAATSRALCIDRDQIAAAPPGASFTREDGLQAFSAARRVVALVAPHVRASV